MNIQLVKGLRHKESTAYCSVQHIYSYISVDKSFKLALFSSSLLLLLLSEFFSSFFKL